MAAHRVLLILLAGIAWTVAQNLTDAQVEIVKARLADSAKESWELGTRSQALLELDTPTFSVLNNTALPPSTSAPASLSDVLNLAATIVANRSESNNNIVGPQPLISDSAAGDPASNGVGVLIANWTGKANSTENYAGDATDQLNFLFQDVPKTSDGAISHRTDQLQLWSDFIYMAPPFIAYYGVTTANQSMVEEAYTQIKLYRNYLRGTSKASDIIWSHIVLGNGTDSGAWSTGNGWAAAGMLRVLGTIKNSPYAGSMKNEQKDLGNWINEIHNAIYPHLQSDNLFLNYANDSSTFADAASTALLAATVYRTALLTNTHTHLPAAERSRKTLSAPAANSTAGSNNGTTLADMAHFTGDGYLTPVVNPHSFGEILTPSTALPGSPEGQAFVVEMHAAWRDWVQNGSPGANAALKTAPSAVLLSVFGLLGMLFIL